MCVLTEILLVRGLSVRCLSVLRMHVILLLAV
jgi:hypothetical protein